MFRSTEWGENEREKKVYFSYSLCALGVLFSSPPARTSGFLVAIYFCIPVLTFGFQVTWRTGQGILEGVKGSIITGSVVLLFLVFHTDPPADVYFSELSNTFPCSLFRFYTWIQYEIKGSICLLYLTWKEKFQSKHFKLFEIYSKIIFKEKNFVTKIQEMLNYIKCSWQQFEYKNSQ